MENVNQAVNVSLNKFKNAKDGSLLVKHGNVWKPIEPKELLSELFKAKDVLEDLKHEITPIINANKVLSREKEEHDNLLTTLTYLVAFLVYERGVDKGNYKECENDNALIGEIMVSDDDLSKLDLPFELTGFIYEILNKAKYGGKK